MKVWLKAIYAIAASVVFPAEVKPHQRDETSRKLGTNCVDSPINWHDADGSTYNCAWYSQDDNCADYGKCCPNNGKTANEVRIDDMNHMLLCVRANQKEENVCSRINIIFSNSTSSIQLQTSKACCACGGGETQVTASNWSLCSSRPLLKLWSGYNHARTRASVNELQKMLNEIQGTDLDVDGYFGRLTESAVRRFQRRKGLSVDGIVGPNTWKVLCSFPTTESIGTTPSTNRVCPEKKIMITTFCINGDRADGGDEAEIKFFLDGRRYYPRYSSHCTQTSRGFCDVTENGCLHLDDEGARWVLVDADDNYQGLDSQRSRT